MICERCKQIIKSKPVYLDAIGRPFDVCSVLLMVKPAYGIIANGITITSDMPLSYNPVVIVPDEMESDGQRWVMYAREKNTGNKVTLDGLCGQKYEHLYYLAKNVGEM